MVAFLYYLVLLGSLPQSVNSVKPKADLRAIYFHFIFDQKSILITIEGQENLKCFVYFV